MANEDEQSPVARAAGTSEGDSVPASVSAADAERAAPRSPWLGRIIDDRYRVVELLAEGGMGTVFIAEHLRLRKTVALKTIHPSFLGNAEVAARFAREAMASAQLEHPHVASAMDYGPLPEGGAYLVLELVHGPSLRAQIDERGAAPWNQVCEIGAQIADALCAAHAMGIVHRDLKPENILLEARHGGPPIVKVLDFGIAWVRSPETQATDAGNTGRALTRVGAVMGTPGYMAPEQAMGAAVDESADLYALGVILWEMLTGRCLFDAPNLTGILTQQLASTPSTRLAQGSVSVPPELAALLEKLLAPQSKDRMHSAAELREVLRSLASRNVASAEAYRIAVPTALRNAAPRLRTVLYTVLRGASPRLRALLANGRQLLARTYGRASPQPRSWALRAGSFLDRLPRKVIRASVAAALVVVTSAVMAAVIAEPEQAHPAHAAAPRVESAAMTVPEPVAMQVAVSPERDVQLQIDVLSNSQSRRERLAAARWLQRSPAKEDVPSFAAALARLELATDCRVQKAALRRLRTLADPRSLPAVTHWYNKPQSGCGLLENRDCYACIRDELRATRRALRQDGTRTPSSGSAP